MSTLADRALEVARMEYVAGVRGGEPPFAKYRGTRVDEYQRSVGLQVPEDPAHPGFFWCAAGVYWCFQRAQLLIASECKGLTLPNRCPRTAGALHMWQFATQACQTQSPSPGCVFVLNRGGGRGHVGFVQQVEYGGVLTTIEPDTSNSELSAIGDAWGRHEWNPADGKRGVLVGYLTF